MTVERAVRMLLSTAEAAQKIGVPEGTLRYWRYVGIGPQSFRVGRHVKYRPEAIESWLTVQEEATSRGGIPQQTAYTAVRDG